MDVYNAQLRAMLSTGGTWCVRTGRTAPEVCGRAFCLATRRDFLIELSSATASQISQSLQIPEVRKPVRRLTATALRTDTRWVQSAEERADLAARIAEATAPVAEVRSELPGATCPGEGRLARPFRTGYPPERENRLFLKNYLANHRSLTRQSLRIPGIVVQPSAHAR